MGAPEGDSFRHETSAASQVPEDPGFVPQSRGSEDSDNNSVPPLARGDQGDSADAVAAGPEGPGLRKVRGFIQKIRPNETEESSGPSWQELQLEPTPTLLPELR